MKVLLKKIKHSNKIFLTLFILTFLIYFIGYALIVKSLFSLSGIETLIRVIIIVLFGLWLIVYFLWSLINLILKKHITLLITLFITVLFSIVFFFLSYYINFIYSSIDNITDSNYINYTSNLVTLNTTQINDNSVLGMINSTDDIEGNVLAKELVNKYNLDKLEVVSYASYYEMINDLLNKKIDGVFLSSNYLSIFGSEEAFKNLSETKAYYSYSKKLKNQDKVTTNNKSLKEPFTILLLGVDSASDGLDANAAFNGDTLMLITFNPTTLNATMFSIPRDTYVPIACNNNRYAKINSSAAYGTNCVIDTIEQLTGIDINYYLKVNFKGVVDLVEALNGIDVDVEVPDYSVYYNQYNGRVCEQNSLRQFGSKLVCMDTGMQHLNGEQALAYARCRHAYLQSDIARNRHQQAIIESIAKKIASPSNINKFENILNSITNNLATNMTTKQILSFYDIMKSMVINSLKDGDFITINKTYLEYYSLPVRTSQNGIFTSAIGYYPDSMNAIIKLMKENLGLEKHEMIKTFSFDSNEDYQLKLVGQGIKTGEKLETMPNFIGKSISEVEAWALERGINLTQEFVNSTSPYYNVNVVPGVVANQSVNNGILLKTVSQLTIYINDINTSIPIEPPDNEDIEDNENIENNDDPLDDILPSDDE